MNPYVRLLQEALSECGVVGSTSGELSPNLVRTWRAEVPPADRRRTVHVLHLHWLELLYGSPRFRSSFRRLATVLLGLVWAKLRGFGIVYTVHNLRPHERAFPALDEVANRVVYALANAVHVHDKETALGVERNYGFRNKVHVIPHGSYIGAYPNHCTRQEARERLELPGDAFVYLFLGQIRRYKGVEDLLHAFNQLPDGTGYLVLAGNVHDPEYVADLVQLTGRKKRLRTWLQYVPDRDVQFFMNACDVCVLPYHEVTTSGAAILAFSFGKPIIAPALGGFAELSAHGRGILYRPQESDGLVEALRKARLQDMAAAGKRALAWAREHEWRTLAPEFLRMYTYTVRAGN
jgi:glycosyltransferase involved in cell wall biosynthesis